MSLVHLVQDLHDENMKNRTNPTSAGSCSPARFSASAYRKAMGPGYPVALFREQQEFYELSSHLEGGRCFT